MKKLYKQAKEKTNYEYAFAKWLRNEERNYDSELFNYIISIYINALKEFNKFDDFNFFYPEYFNLDILDNIENYSYNEINSYIKDTISNLPYLLTNYIIEDVFGDFLMEVISTENIYPVDIIENWAKEKGLDKFCKENKINKDNLNINIAIKYFEDIIVDYEFDDIYNIISKKPMVKEIVKDYVKKGLDIFAKYYLENVFKLRDEKYNEEKNEIDELINQEKADNYMRNIMQNGIDYQKLEGKLKNRILRRMAKMNLF